MQGKAVSAIALQQQRNIKSDWRYLQIGVNIPALEEYLHGNINKLHEKYLLKEKW